MRYLLLLLLAVSPLALFVACQAEAQSPSKYHRDVEAWEDPHRNIVCYIYYGGVNRGGISCIHMTGNTPR